MKAIKKPALAGPARLGLEKAGGVCFSDSEFTSFPLGCQSPPLSAEASARLQRLAEATGLPPQIILNSLVTAADAQLVGVCVRETRRRGLSSTFGLG